MWHELISGVLTALCLASAVPCLVVALQVLAARPPGANARPGDQQPLSRTERPSVAVLVPAHNEAAGLAATLATIRPQLTARDRLLVVADNCSDETASVALGAGAEVVSRADAARRGKGHALDFGLRHLANDPRAVVVFVDADCSVGEGCIDQLARACRDRGRPVQALDLMLAPRDALLKLRFAEFAWRVKNMVRPNGALRLGWPCQLMGTGMAIGWPYCMTLQLASARLAEDMQMGIDLSLRGYPPLFVPTVHVSSRFPSTIAAADRQHARWENGHVHALVRGVPALLVGALRRRDARLVAMALDLCVPPLALLTLWVGLLGFVGVGWWLLSGDGVPVSLSIASGLLIVLAVAYAWRRWAVDLLSARELACAPLYALRKLGLYLRMPFKAPLGWVRAQRDDER